MPEALLDLPEVGHLAAEGGPMHLAEGREPLVIMHPELAKVSLVGVQADELSFDLDGEDLGVEVLRTERDHAGGCGVP